MEESGPGFRTDASQKSTSIPIRKMFAAQFNDPPDTPAPTSDGSMMLEPNNPDANTPDEPMDDTETPSPDTTTPVSTTEPDKLAILDDSSAPDTILNQFHQPSSDLTPKPKSTSSPAWTDAITTRIQAKISLPSKSSTEVNIHLEFTRVVDALMKTHRTVLLPFMDVESPMGITSISAIPTNESLFHQYCHGSHITKDGNALYFGFHIMHDKMSLFKMKEPLFKWLKTNKVFLEKTS